MQAQVDASTYYEAEQPEASSCATELYERLKEYGEALRKAKEKCLGAEEKLLPESMYRHAYTSYTDKNVQDWIGQRAAKVRQGPRMPDSRQSQSTWNHSGPHPVDSSSMAACG